MGFALRVRRNWLPFVKSVLTRAGAVTPKWAVTFLDESLNYIETGRWLRARGFHVPRRVRHRIELFDLIGREVADREVLYLEFGVYYGESMRYWSKLLRNPRSVLHGFDSFEGLPSVWKDNSGKGSFSTGGVVPEFDDPRVRLFVGRFDAVLPTYTPPEAETVVINIDADLYESTICVLEGLRGLMKPGVYLYFDEFCFRAHELRAFDEFLQETGFRFRILGADRTLQAVAFQFVE